MRVCDARAFRQLLVNHATHTSHAWSQHQRVMVSPRDTPSNWGCGLLSILLGVWCHRKWNAWLGMAAIIAGFSEMAYWTTPLARPFGGMPEFER